MLEIDYSSGAGDSSVFPPLALLPKYNEEGKEEVLVLKQFICIVVIFFLVIIQSTIAECATQDAGMIPINEIKAANLAWFCDSEEEVPKVMCVGYLLGAIDTFIYITDSQKEAKIGGFSNDLCLPKDLGVEQVKPLVVDYLLRHKDIYADPAFKLVYLTIIEKWQCE